MREKNRGEWYKILIKPEMSNSYPQAKFEPQCNNIWPKRKYKIKTRVGMSELHRTYRADTASPKIYWYCQLKKDILAY